MFKGHAQGAAGRVLAPRGALGGQENAFTSRDYTGYYQQIPSHRLEDGDAAGGGPVCPQPVARRGVPEIEVVKEERRLRTEDQPAPAVAEQLNAATFNASPYRRPSWAG